MVDDISLLIKKKKKNFILPKYRSHQNHGTFTYQKKKQIQCPHTTKHYRKILFYYIHFIQIVVLYENV